jgi:hypothetical protein
MGQKIYRKPVKLDATGTTANNASAIFEVNATDKGVLLPRMTSAEKNALTKVEGLIVYDTDLDSLCQTNGAVWSTLSTITTPFITSDVTINASNTASWTTPTFTLSPSITYKVDTQGADITLMLPIYTSADLNKVILIYKIVTDGFRTTTSNSNALLRKSQDSIGYICTSTGWTAFNYSLSFDSWINTVTANYTVSSTDEIVVQTTSGTTTTLPSAIGLNGRKFTIKNASAGDITINTTSSQTIDGQLTQILSTYNSINVVSDGTNYYII